MASVGQNLNSRHSLDQPKAISMSYSRRDTDRIGTVSKRYQYVTLRLQPRVGTAKVVSLTIHQAEAEKLAELLRLAAAAPVDESFSDSMIGRVEGIYPCGPPERSDLVEFMKPKPWEGGPD